MSLTAEDVKSVAHLARLNIADDEILTHVKNLSNILDLIAQMDKANTNDVTPMAHPLDVNQPLRSDEITEPNQRNEFQKIASSVEAGLYLVPQVIE